MSKEETIKELTASLANREDTLLTLLNRANGAYIHGPDGDFDGMEEAQEELDNLPLDISTTTTLKVLLSTGGPADWLTAEIEVMRDSSSQYGEGSWERVSPVTYHYAPWFDHAEIELDDDSALVQYFDNVVENHYGN